MDEIIEQVKEFSMSGLGKHAITRESVLCANKNYYDSRGAKGSRSTVQKISQSVAI